MKIKLTSRNVSKRVRAPPEESAPRRRHQKRNLASTRPTIPADLGPSVVHSTNDQDQHQDNQQNHRNTPLPPQIEPTNTRSSPGAINWPDVLPSTINETIFTYCFTNTSTTYTFAPGHRYPPFTITSSPPTHTALLSTSKSIHRQVLPVYFRTVQVQFRGYDRFLSHSIVFMPCLCRTITELNLGLHMARYALLSGTLGKSNFGVLRRIVLEDVSDDGFEIEGEYPGDKQILGALFGRESELLAVHLLLVGGGGGGGSGSRAVVSNGASMVALPLLLPPTVEVVFYFELPAPRLGSPVDQSQHQHHPHAMETRGKEHNTVDVSRKYILNVRDKTLRQTGTKLKFSKT